MVANFLRFTAPLLACAITSGCLQNAVHPVTKAGRMNPDSGHAIVVVGVGVETPWPFSAFSISLDEYSVKKRDIAGNCFRYNHIVATIPPSPAKVTYFAYKVPAGIYVYSPFNANAALLSSAGGGSGFIAPPGKAVYFGDYVFVGNRTVGLRSDIDAARVGIGGLLTHGVVLEQAAPTIVARVHPFLCTP
jgi:hypothetical protein